MASEFVASMRGIEFNVGDAGEVIEKPVKAVRFRAIKEHLCSDLDGGAVVLNLNNGTYFGLNSVGYFIWQTLREERTLDDIVAAVLEVFEVEEEVCRKEVDKFLADVLGQGLVVRIDG